MNIECRLHVLTELDTYGHNPRLYPLTQECDPSMLAAHGLLTCHHDRSDSFSQFSPGLKLVLIDLIEQTRYY